MQLHEWLNILRDEMARFEAEWLKSAKNDPDNFSLEMSREEWEEQFLSWYQLEQELKEKAAIKHLDRIINE